MAERANVSIATVSRTINNPAIVDPETARRVWTAIEELSFYPNTQARSLVSGRSRLLGFIVSDITNPFFPDLIRGFQDVAIREGYDILVSSTNYDSSQMAVSVRRMLERRVDGVAIMTSEMDAHLIDQLARKNVPLVFLDVGTPGAGISNILVDYESGVRQAVDHLVALGHRRIGFVSGPNDLKSACIRRSAFLRSLELCGLHEDDMLVVQGDHKVGGGLRAMNELLQLSQAPTAVLASNDLTAVGMLRAVRRAGLKVPSDISIVGFDDIWLAEFTDPALTTVRLPRTEIAEVAFQALVDGSSDAQSAPREFTIQTRLIIRETTAPRQTSATPAP